MKKLKEKLVSWDLRMFHVDFRHENLLDYELEYHFDRSFDPFVFLTSTEQFIKDNEESF